MAEGHQVVDRVISIHALREEGDEGRHSSQQRISISIHALREEGDGPLSCAAVVNDRISIHALREEGDRFALPFRFPPIKFLSTPSARRATAHHNPAGLQRENFYPRPPRRGRRALRGPSTTVCYFYPRPPRGGRPERRAQSAVDQQISIHALREEGDGPPVKPRNLLTSFLSTPSARRATPRLQGLRRHYRISIHALREEGDQDFLPSAAVITSFLSTPSVRRATAFSIAIIAGRLIISIHALREEGDMGLKSTAALNDLFLSTPSARRATCAMRCAG